MSYDDVSGGNDEGRSRRMQLGGDTTLPQCYKVNLSETVHMFCQDVAGSDLNLCAGAKSVIMSNCTAISSCASAVLSLCFHDGLCHLALQSGLD